MPVFTMLTVQDSVAAERSYRIARLNRIQGYGWAGGLGVGTVWTLAADRVFTLSPLASERAFLWACVGLAWAGALTATRWLPARTRDTGTTSARMPFRQPIPTTLFPFLPAQLYRRFRGFTAREFVARFTPQLATYFLAVALFFAGFGVFFAPLPAYLSDVGYAPADVYFLFLVAALGSAVTYGYAGRLVARYEIPPVQAVALGVRAVGVLALALVHGSDGGNRLLTATLLFAVIGTSWAVVATGTVDHIADLAPASIRGESLGVYSAMAALAGGVGSLLGGYLAEFVGYTPTFAVACAVVLVSALVVLSPDRLGLPNRLPVSEPSRPAE